MATPTPGFVRLFTAFSLSQSGCRMLRFMLWFLAGACLVSGEAPSLLCRILTVHGIDEGGESREETHCEVVGTFQQYLLEVPMSIMEEHGPDLLSGDTFLQILDATIEEESLVTGISTRFSVVHRHTRKRRLFVPTTGTKSISVIRVSTQDVSPTVSIQSMQNMLQKDQVNVVTQMLACSQGDLKFQSKGVHNVTVSMMMDNYTSAIALVNEAVDLLEDDQIADHILLCLPPGTPGSWIARASNNHWKSWYNNEWCTSLSAGMHELGEYTEGFFNFPFSC